MKQNASNQNPPELNEQQLDMIRLFKRPMPEDDFLQMRKLAVQLLGKQLDEVMDNWEKDNNITREMYEKWSKEHKRTPYKRQK